MLLSLLTTELVPPQPKDQALHTYELRSTSTFLFSPFWKRKHADYTAFQKGKQLSLIPEQSSLLKLKSWVFSHGKNEAGKGKSCDLLVEEASLCLAALYDFNCKGSWYKLGLPVFPPCWQAVSSQDIPCRRSKVWKNKHKQQFGKMKRRERSVMSFFLPWKTSPLPSQSVPSYSVTSCKLFPLREGGKKKATYFKYLASSYLNKETDKDANAQFLSLVTQKKMAEWLDMSLHGLQLLTSAHKALFHF